MKSIFILCFAMVSCACQTTNPKANTSAIISTVVTPTAQVIRIPLFILPEPEYVDVDGFRRLTLYGAVDDMSVNILISALADKKDVEGFILEINSGGGSVNAGFALSKAIENSSVPVHCFVDGEGMSMAYYILQSCSTRSMTKRSVLMIHGPSINGGGDGNSNDWMTIAELLRAMQNAMIEHCAARMKISPAVLKEKIEVRSWWINWDEALKVGAVDYIVDDFKDELKIAKNFR